MADAAQPSGVEPTLAALRNMHVRETVRENHLTAITGIQRNTADPGHENMLVAVGATQCNVYDAAAGEEVGLDCVAHYAPKAEGLFHRGLRRARGCAG